MHAAPQSVFIIPFSNDHNRLCTMIFMVAMAAFHRCLIVKQVSTYSFRPIQSPRVRALIFVPWCTLSEFDEQRGLRGRKRSDDLSDEILHHVGLELADLEHLFVGHCRRLRALDRRAGKL